MVAVAHRGQIVAQIRVIADGRSVSADMKAKDELGNRAYSVLLLLLLLL